MITGTVCAAVFAVIAIDAIVKGGWERAYFLTIVGVVAFIMGTIWLGALVFE